MDDRSKEAYEETLDNLVLELYARENEAQKLAERWHHDETSGSQREGMLTLSPQRAKARAKRECAAQRARVEALRHARLTVEKLLKEGDPTPLSQVQLMEFERLVFDAFKDSSIAKRDKMLDWFRRMSLVQRRQAWLFVSGREPPPTEDFEHKGFLAFVLKDLLPEV